MPLIKDIATKKTFVIKLSDDIIPGNYKFNIVATDDLGRPGTVSVFLNAANQGVFLTTITKLGLSTQGGIPYILMFLPILIIVTMITNRIIPEKVPGRVGFGLLSGLIFAFLVVFFL